MAGFNAFFNWYHDNGIIPNIWKGATGQLSQEKINEENLQYQKERNAIEDARYEEETAYNRAFAENERDYQRGRDTLADQRYQEELNYNRAFAEDERAYQRAFSAEEQAYNRAFAEDERAYQRAFSAEEQAYNRAFSENERNYQREWALNQRDYERSLQEKIFEREDTAIARQADALRAQGINPLSQSMNGLGAGSLVSSSSAPKSGYSGNSSGSSSYSGSSAGSSSAPSSPGFSGGSMAPIPGLSNRGGKALQKAMITSQGINGLLGPILQTMNTVDNLRGNGLQRDILNANAMKAQAEANISVMEMYDMSNRLNTKGFNFHYGKGRGRKYSWSQSDESYNPYFYTPQQVQLYEQEPKRLQALITGRQADNLDSVHDAMSFLTEKLSNFVQTKSGIELDDKLKTSLLQSLSLHQKINSLVLFSIILLSSFHRLYSAHNLMHRDKLAVMLHAVVFQYVPTLFNSIAAIHKLSI